MQIVQADHDALNSSGQFQPLASPLCPPFSQEKPESQTKNKKWTDEEHVLYILFLESNRNKIKSKLIRRSNSFYKEMAAFIKGKNGIQCRSHHTKFETRYKFPHKIIREEKEKLDPELYNSIKSSLSLVTAPTVPSLNMFTEVEQKTTKTQKERPSMKSMSCQTQIQGVNQPLLQPQQVNQYYKWLNHCSEIQKLKHAEFMMNWNGPNPFFPLGGYYMNRPF